MDLRSFHCQPKFLLRLHYCYVCILQVLQKIHFCIFSSLDMSSNLKMKSFYLNEIFWKRPKGPYDVENEA